MSTGGQHGKHLGYILGRVGLVTYFYFYWAKYLGYLDPARLSRFSFLDFQVFGGTILVVAVAALYRAPTALAGLLLGETLVQLAVLPQVNWWWVLPLVPFAVLPGLPKHERGKYSEAPKLVPLGILATSAAFASFGLGCLVQYLQAGTLAEEALGGLLVMFLGQFVSGFFLALALVIAVERLTTRREFFYHPLLTHHLWEERDHAFPVAVNGTRVYFCSRCGGMVIGVFWWIFLDNFLDLGLVEEAVVVLIFLAPVPGLLDWGTQKVGLRQSNTAGRLATGFGIGTGLFLLGYVDQYRGLVLSVITVYFVIFGALYFFGHRVSDRRAERSLASEMEREAERETDSLDQDGVDRRENGIERDVVEETRQDD